MAASKPTAHLSLKTRQEASTSSRYLIYTLTSVLCMPFSRHRCRGHVISGLLLTVKIRSVTSSVGRCYGAKAACAIIVLTQVAPLQLSIFSCQSSNTRTNEKCDVNTSTLPKSCQDTGKIKRPELSLRVSLSSCRLLPYTYGTQKESETLVSAGRRSVGVPAKGFCSLICKQAFTNFFKFMINCPSPLCCICVSPTSKP